MLEIGGQGAGVKGLGGGKAGERLGLANSNDSSMGNPLARSHARRQQDARVHRTLPRDVARPYSRESASGGSERRMSHGRVQRLSQGDMRLLICASPIAGSSGVEGNDVGAVGSGAANTNKATASRDMRGSSGFRANGASTSLVVMQRQKTA